MTLVPAQNSNLKACIQIITT